MVKLLRYYAFFAVIYILLAVLTTPFFISWRRERSWLEKAYVTFIGSPFDYSKSLWLVLVNSLFWFLILYLIIVGVRKLIVMVQQKQ